MRLVLIRLVAVQVDAMLEVASATLLATPLVTVAITSRALAQVSKKTMLVHCVSCENRVTVIAFDIVYEFSSLRTARCA